MRTMIEILIVLTSSFIVNYVFMYWQFSVKPKLDASSTIAYIRDKDILELVILNRGRRQLHNIEVQLIVAEIYPREDEMDRRTIHRAKMSWHTFPGMDPFVGWPPDPWQLPVAARLRTSKASDVIKILTSSTEYERKLLFIYTASDAISGTRIINRKVYTMQDIKEGVLRITREGCIFSPRSPEPKKSVVKINTRTLKMIKRRRRALPISLRKS